MAILQQQVRTLQAQFATLQAAVQVTPTGVTLQGPTVTIAGGVVTIQAQNNVALRAGGPLDLKGSMIRLNGGTKPLATLGSQVKVETSTGPALGQIVTGSQTILGN